MTGATVGASGKVTSEGSVALSRPDGATSGRRRRRKVAVFGLFGQGNLGNDVTLEAILHHLRRYSPDAEVICICTGPEAAAGAYKIAAVPAHEIFIRPWRNPVLRLLRKAVLGIPCELYRWIRAFRMLADTDMVVVPGTQFLSDHLTGPWGWPYLAIKWATVAKLRRCRLLFVSVGVGPLLHPLSRLFVKAALRLADFRSYRDDASVQYLRRIGFDPAGDGVSPDLVFSLPTPASTSAGRRLGARPVVGVGVKDCRSDHGLALHTREGADAYRRYLATTAAFVVWLLDRGYAVRLVLGDMAHDEQVLTDLRDLLRARHARCGDEHLIHEPIRSTSQLISQLAASDLIVSPRYHNVVLGLLLERPVIALAYHDKFSGVMEQVGLAQYHLRVDHLEEGAIMAKFLDLEQESRELKQSIQRRLAEHRDALEAQYEVIFGDLARG